MKKLLNIAWNYIKLTKLGKLVLSFVLLGVSLLLSEIWDAFYYISFVFLIYPIGLLLVMLAYAWVINPIREWKETKKMKADYAASVRSEVSAKLVEETIVTPVEMPKEISKSVEEPATIQKKKRGPKKKKK